MRIVNLDKIPKEIDSRHLTYGEQIFFLKEHKKFKMIFHIASQTDKITFYMVPNMCVENFFSFYKPRRYNIKTAINNTLCFKGNFFVRP